ncbi:MAG: AbrB/MazE/SpoVT family DNA-binding domain-containing protein [Rhodospirillaceae bacterium]|nr:AbrB/MazE/SpoVT family DNA-binding domain-containing protein [Rhodospirillaceae bacterium]
MSNAQSKITAQGQISVPAEIRRKLGLGRGSVLEWEQRDDEVVVRRAGRFTSQDVHRALFPHAPSPSGASKSAPKDVKQGIAKYIRKRHARG